jgi:hypothetical protein
MEQDENEQEPSSGQRMRGNGTNRTLGTLALVAVLLVIAIVGYLVVDTILALRQPIIGAPGALSTQVQQVLNPTPTIIASPQTVVREVQNLARLETSSYTIEKVITAQSGEGPLGFLFQDKLLLVAQGQVIAGVDLARMSVDDVQIAGTTAYVTLPAAEIFVATLDNENTYVYDRQTGLFGQQIDLETLARQEAEAAILQAALEDGILTQAQDNAEAYVGGLIRALGFEQVVFIAGTPGPDQNQGDR